MLDLQPTLVGAHITVRPLEASDFQELFAAASDPLVWAQHPDPSRGTREGFALYFDGALKSKASLVAIDTSRSSIIGCSRYSKYTAGERISIGYTFLARSHWGGAANAEIKRLMLHHAFTDVREVLFEIAERNARSRRAVEKLGAELVGAENTPRWGQTHIIYRLMRELWTRDAVPGTGRSHSVSHSRTCTAIATSMLYTASLHEGMREIADCESSATLSKGTSGLISRTFDAMPLSDLAMGNRRP